MARNSCLILVILFLAWLVTGCKRGNHTAEAEIAAGPGAAAEDVSLRSQAPGAGQPASLSR